MVIYSYFYLVGVTIQSMKRVVAGKYIAILAVVLTGFGALYWIKYTAEVKRDEFRNNVSYMMKDPASAQFRNEKIVNGLMCGEMNSKNSYGSYVGFKRFISSSPTYAYIEGIGYVGQKAELSLSERLDDLTERLKTETAILKEQNALAKEQGWRFVAMSDSEKAEEAARRIFTKRWDRVCT